MRKVFTVILSLALVLGIFASAAPRSSAANITELKKTLYVGQKFVFKNPVASNPFKKATSSNKKVATVKKNSKNKITITAKKKGTAMITIKTKQKITYWYTIEVKAKSTSWKAYTPYNKQDEDTSRYTGNVMFEVVNESGVYAADSMVSYELFGAAGNVVATGEQRILELVPNEKIHFFAIANNLTEPVTSGKITNIKLNQDENAPKYKYTDKTDDIVIKEIDKTVDSLKFSITNKSKENISGTAEVIFYKDAAATQPMGIMTFNLYTNANATNYESITTPMDYATYKVFKRAHTSKYTGDKMLR